MGVAERAGSRGPAKRVCERPRVTPAMRCDEVKLPGQSWSSAERAGSRGPAKRGCERARVMPAMRCDEVKLPGQSWSITERAVALTRGKRIWA